jgi:membrane-associated protein
MGNLGGPPAKAGKISVILLSLCVLCAAGIGLYHFFLASDGFFTQIIQNLFNSHELMKILQKPEFTILSFVALNLIVFIETGLLVGFFLPGDSLLVTAGLVCSGAPEWSLPLLLFTLCVSAILGDSVGYAIGRKTGPKIFCREKSFFFHKDHLLKAQDFYQKHGGKTIILARFMPIIRTFAPVVAGVGKMEYRKFLFFNVFGGVGWVMSMILFGYYLPTVINPILRPMFGEQFEVQDHIEKVVILVVLLSISPGIFLWLRTKWKGKPADPQAPKQEQAASQLAQVGE